MTPSFLLSKQPSNVRLEKLKTLERDIKSFNADRIYLVHGYLKKTGIETSIIDILEGLRNTLKNSYEESLHEQYEKIKFDLCNLLQERVSYIQKPELAKGNNVWLRERSEKPDDKLSDQLERFGSKWADLNFECKIVIENNLKDFAESCVNDLKFFRQKRLASSLEQLHKSNKDTYTEQVMESLFHKMQNLINNLEVAFSKKKFEEAETLLAKITRLAQESLC